MPSLSKGEPDEARQRRYTDILIREPLKRDGLEDLEQ